MLSEEPFTPFWKIAYVLTAAVWLCILALGAWFVFTMARIGHDKDLNAGLQSMWIDPRGAPLGIVVPAKNRWLDHAFVADRPRQSDKRIAVLILDDHYRSGDESLRTSSGIVGDEISRQLLCSLPSQAARKNVTLDEVLRGHIATVCRVSRDSSM